MSPGAAPEWHLARSADLAPAFEESAIGDFVVVNDDRSIRDVALEALARAGWRYA